MRPSQKTVRAHALHTACHGTPHDWQLTILTVLSSAFWKLLDMENFLGHAAAEIHVLCMDVQLRTTFALESEALLSVLQEDAIRSTRAVLEDEVDPACLPRLEVMQACHSSMKVRPQGLCHPRDDHAVALHKQSLRGSASFRYQCCSVGPSARWTAAVLVLEPACDMSSTLQL